MELKDTVSMMLSNDYKERFKAEYYQTRIRRDKLNNMIIKLAYRQLDFTPDCPIVLFERQVKTMDDYLDMLIIRAKIEGIELEEN